MRIERYTPPPPCTKTGKLTVLHSVRSLVPMKSRDELVKDGKQMKTPGGKLLLTEYDGLESGELAWIYGRAVGPERRPTSYALGHGPDRMQRLAYTAYVEAYFQASNLKDVVINLGAVQLTDSTDSDATTFVAKLANATALSSVDVAHACRPATIGGAALASGIFTMSKGPFLRGKMRTDVPVDIVDPKSSDTTYTVERNLGDKMAFDALFQTMQNEGIFDWKPDGMVLSKLESPSGEPLSSMELDARQAQLFNLAIQGPAIAKTWTGRSELVCMPLDKVFMLVVARVTSSAGAISDDDLKKEVGFFKEGETGAVTAAWGALALKAVDDKDGGPKNSTLSNFRLMRATSSYLAANSHYKPGNAASRCNLGLLEEGGLFAGDYIVGGWCIGTVVDNAASRSTIGHQVRIAPMSMALNVNVNIEWWSGDKLHRHYMDVDGNVQQRGTTTELPLDPVNAPNKGVWEKETAVAAVGPVAVA